MMRNENNYLVQPYWPVGVRELISIQCSYNKILLFHTFHCTALHLILYLYK